MDIDEDVVSPQDVEVAPESAVAAVVDCRFVHVDEGLDDAGVESGGVGEGEVPCELDRGLGAHYLDIIWEEGTGVDGQA